MNKKNSLVIASKAVNEIAEILSQNNISGRILYIYSPTADELYGHIVCSQIESIGELCKEKARQNTISYALSLAERVIATDITCIVCMGGGKVLDIGKYSAYISKIPLMSIASTMSNDGVASAIAVLKRKDAFPKSLGCAAPTMLVIDTDIICSGPEELIKAGIGDTISNRTALMDWKLACQRGKDEMNGYAYIMSEAALDIMTKTQYEEINPGFIEVLARSFVLSGYAMELTGNSRPVSGSEHLFSHALDYYGNSKNLHGLQVALGTVATLELMEEDSSEIIGYLDKFDVNVNPIHLGIDKDLFIHCMKHGTGMRKDRYTFLHEANLEDANLSMIYQKLIKEL